MVGSKITRLLFGVTITTAMIPPTTRIAVMLGAGTTD